MNQRQCTLPLTAFGIFVGLLAYTVLTLPPGEPRYHGKPLHYWLSRIHNQSLPLEEQDRTRIAVTTIGTNNLPLLLEWFREEEPPQSEPTYRKAINWLLSRQRFAPYRLDYNYRPSRPSMAMWVFTDFPDVAAKAIPQFIACLSDKDDTIKGKAALVLGKIGQPALTALIPVLSGTNDIARAVAVWAVGDLGTNALHLRPEIETMSNDPSIYVRLNSAVSLDKLGGNPETVVSVILGCIHEGDRDTRMYALDCLAKMKDRASAAVPDLTNSIAKATNAEDRMFLLNALREIDSEQAATFASPRPAGPQTPEESSTNPDQPLVPDSPQKPPPHSP